MGTESIGSKNCRKKAAKAANNEATKEVMAHIWAGDDGRFKRMLLVPTRDCLTTTDTY